MATNVINVTRDWRLDGDMLVPTREHLSNFCKRVTALRSGDRLVRFRCKSTRSTGSRFISVHYSRIQIQGGSLFDFVTSHDQATPATKFILVDVDESETVFKPIADYLYRSHVDLSAVAIHDTIAIAASANKWGCHDLFVGALLHVVSRNRFHTPISFPSEVRLKWLAASPPAFLSYLSHYVNNILRGLSYSQLVDVVSFAAQIGDRKIWNETLKFVVVSDALRNERDLALLLPVFLREPVPPFFVEYMSSRVLQFFGNLLTFLSSSEAYERSHAGSPSTTTTRDVRQFVRSTGKDVFLVSHGQLWQILQANHLAFSVIRDVIHRGEFGDADFLFWLVLRYLEPLHDDEAEVLAVLEEIAPYVKHREKLLTDDELYRALSARALRLAAIAILRPASEDYELQLTLKIRGASLTGGELPRPVNGSINDVHFYFKVHILTTGDKFSFELTFDASNGSDGRLYESINYAVIVATRNCECESYRGAEKRTRGILWNGSKDEDDETGEEPQVTGYLTIFDENEVQSWNDRHKCSCELRVIVLLCLKEKVASG